LEPFCAAGLHFGRMRPLWACPTAVGIATTTRTRMCGRSSSSSRRIIDPGSVGRGGGAANAGGGKLGAMLAPIFLACMVAPPQSAMAWLQPPPRVEFTAGSARVGGRTMGMGGRGGRMRPSGVGLVHVRCLNRYVAANTIPSSLRCLYHPPRTR
jgi:hypothetical protein